MGKIAVQRAKSSDAWQEVPSGGLKSGHRSIEQNALLVGSELSGSAVTQTPDGHIVKTRQEHEQNAKVDHSAVTSYPEIEIINGAAGISARLAALGLEAESEVANCVQGGAQRPERLAEARSIAEETFSRGVRSRSVFLSNLRNDRATLDYVAWLNEHGGEVRTTSTLPIRMIIQDRKIAVVPVDPDNTMSGIVICRMPSVVLALQELFEKIWDSATLLGKACAHNDPGLSIQERDILQLLTAGWSSVEVGNAMGFAERTARRKIRDLFARLDTESPFVAGYRAAKKGWL